MLTTNLNTTTLTIFTIFLIVSMFVFYLNFKEYKTQKNKFKFYQVGALLISFLILSLAIFGFKTVKNQDNSFFGTNIVFTLDVSKSMKALDFQESSNLYSRLQAAKGFIGDFISKFTGNKYALVVFAGDSMRVLPFSDDPNLFLTMLSGVDENNVTKQGTNIEDAINNGLKNFTKDNPEGVLVLISDGDDGNTIDLSKIANNDLGKKIKLLVIGVGSTKGAYIPVGQDVFGQINYKTYNGSKVVTKLDEKNLKAIADKYNGTYYSLDNLKNIDKLGNLLDGISKKEILTKSENSYDMTRNIVILSFVFFVLYLVLLLKYDKNK